jgi:hypothetical protein
MSQTQKQYIDRIQWHGIRESEGGIAQQIGMGGVQGFAGLTAAVRKGDLRERMLKQQADQFAAGISGRAQYANLNLFHQRSV